MKTIWTAACFIVSASVALAVDLPCTLGTYRISTTSSLALVCPERFVSISGTAELFLVKNGSVDAAAGKQTGGELARQDLNWIAVSFDSPMTGGNDYEVRMKGNITTSSSTVAFEQSFRFSTKPGATLSIPLKSTSTSYFYGSQLWIASLIEFASPGDKLILESEDVPGAFLPHTATVDMNRSAPGSLDPIGTAMLSFDELDAPKRLNARFRATGLKDIFNQDVPIRAKKRLALPSSPKAKEDAFFYAKILHQAGVNSRPAWILDGKLAPLIPIRALHYWQIRPTAESDIGQGGAIGKTKTNDYIKFGLGIGKFIRTSSWGPIQGIDPTVGAAYETDYAGAKKNFLFVSDARFFLAGTDNPLKERNFRRYIKEKNCDSCDLPQGMTLEACKKRAVVEPQDATKEFFGFKLRAFAGVEMGSQISDQEAKATEGSSKISVPGYKIARIRPKLEMDFEFGRLTLTLSGTPRYLALTEKVYRERDVTGTDGKIAKEVYLDHVSGFRPSGDIGLSIALDDAGHYSLTSSLKLGSLPPNFQRVVVVQSGFTVKF